MTREEYIKYVEKGDIMPIAYEYWKEFKKPEYKNLDFREFLHYYSDYYEDENMFNKDGGLKKILKHFDDKFIIVKLHAKPIPPNKKGELLKIL